MGLDDNFKTYILAATKKAPATTTAAELMGRQEFVGSIEKNKFADLIAVDGDPLADISVLQHVVLVIKVGKQVKPIASE